MQDSDENSSSKYAASLSSQEREDKNSCFNKPLVCKIRRVKNKGAVLVIVLSYLITSTLYLLSTFNILGHQRTTRAYWALPFAITSAVAGFLADGFVGRYKVIRCSIWMIWLLMIIVTASSVAAQLDNEYDYSNDIFVSIAFCLIGIGLGGFQANIIQFGLDQLQDASTIEIISFIVWYVNTFILAGFVIVFNFTCLYGEYRLFILLLISL